MRVKREKGMVGVVVLRCCCVGDGGGGGGGGGGRRLGLKSEGGDAGASAVFSARACQVAMCASPVRARYRLPVDPGFDDRTAPPVCPPPWPRRCATGR